ncbi:O-antigen ligase [Brevundimonas sp. M20]|uniref:O-antigen ligase family protein n=1 Tax=Brevundimonas sp. M20 TaxID=2591463 RepID=UPI001146B3A4|nr:O-antigen ligase family protein [Brevundimonas sp. M20]QDH72464.1 O-antigen ligase family protein [Brevundimonas sp. M20]
MKGQWDGVAIAATLLLALSFVFGGASREHALRLALVELAALPLLVMSADRLLRSGEWKSHRFALGLLGAFIAIPLIQLIPLPPAIWTSLPGRSEMVLALELAGIQPAWAPLTVTPDLTWQSVLAILPPAAMFLAVLGSSQAQTARMLAFYLVAAVVSVLLGAVQLASGDTRFYLWATTAAGSVTGFFANRNHLATLLLACLPFAAVFGAAVLRRRSEQRLPLWFGALFMGLVVVGLAAIRSRAGVILFGPIAVASLLAAWIAAGRGRPGPGLIALTGGVAAAIGAVAILALPPILARFDVQSAPEGRFEGWPIVASAADSWLPVGSGIGSFDAVYRSVEPLDQLDPTFFNHAHNEYLETWLEAGWFGAALIIAFLIWYGRRLWAAWRAGPSRERDLQRAASIALLTMLVHSGVDYPLRTAALAVLFALCAAILDKAGQPTERERG